MKEFDDIEKRMPYDEKDEYIDQLVERATEKAIKEGEKSFLQRVLEPKVRPLYAGVAAAAVVLLLFTVGITQLRTHEDQVAILQQESEVLMADSSTESADVAGPIDEFLNGLSDEEIQMLAYYEMEDIPEYE